MSEVEDASGFDFESDGRSEDSSADRREEDARDGLPVLIDWATPDEVPSLQGDTVGIGGSSAVTGNGETRYVTGVVVLDEQEYDQMERTGQDRAATLILAHELGHVLGLDHVDDPKQLMNPSYVGQRGFGDGDLAGFEDPPRHALRLRQHGERQCETACPGSGTPSERESSASAGNAAPALRRAPLAGGRAWPGSPGSSIARWPGRGTWRREPGHRREYALGDRAHDAGQAPSPRAPTRSSSPPARGRRVGWDPCEPITYVVNPQTRRRRLGVHHRGTRSRRPPMPAASSSPTSGSRRHALATRHVPRRQVLICVGRRERGPRRWPEERRGRRPPNRWSRATAPTSSSGDVALETSDAAGLDEQRSTAGAAELILAHQLGHILGLDDVDDPRS